MQTGKVTQLIWPVCVVFLLLQSLGLLWIKEQNRQAQLSLQALERNQIKAANFWETLEADRYLLTTYLRLEKAAQSVGMIQAESTDNPVLIHYGQVRTH
jgi:cell division protein FtsL